MNIMYLSEDYVGSRVHHNLCQAMCETNENIKLEVFSLKRKNYSGRDITSTYYKPKYNVHIATPAINTLLYKYWFPYKTNTKYNILAETIDLGKIDLCIASTLFSEGATALKLYKEKHIPYIVAVRATDANLYMKKMFHLHKLGREIITNARKIIFITSVLRTKTLECRAMEPVKNIIMDKGEVITNGVDNIWLDNKCIENNTYIKDSILYVGSFNKNKNVLNLIKACKIAKKRHPGLTLNLIGGGGNQEREVLKTVEEHSSWIKYLGPIYDKTKLIQEYRKNSVFAMVSYSETFGLVYIEALTQGLPIIYTKGQGASNMFSSAKTGEEANPYEINDISDKIDLAFRNRTQLSQNITAFPFEDFRWNNIALRWTFNI